VTPDADEELPLVSIVVPMLDEIEAVQHCIDGFAAQEYPLDRIEVLIVDGGSSDGSRELVERERAAKPWIRLVENPKRKASAAFNAGIRAARGDVVCLFSSHGVAGPDFVGRSVEVLRSTGAAGVGGRLVHEGVDRTSRAIGLAMTSPFGMASPFRYATGRREVDTIGHPAYLRQVLEEVGWFDESLERNSDYEYNWRLRAAGHRLVFEPEIVTVYRPRGTVSSLARQFWFYGRWKERVVRRHPGSVRPRHLVPPLAVAAMPAGLLLAAVSRRGRLLAGAVAFAYAGAVAVATERTKPAEHDADGRVVAVCFPVMHVAWGAGFLVSFLEDLMTARRREPR
jgi:succinoglycan biosynthesis protein ExoA